MELRTSWKFSSNNEIMEAVGSFKYLERCFSGYGGLKEEVKIKVGGGGLKTFDLCVSSDVKTEEGVVRKRCSALDGAEVWYMKHELMDVEMIQMKCLQSMGKVTRMDRMRKADARRRASARRNKSDRVDRKYF